MNSLIVGAVTLPIIAVSRGDAEPRAHFVVSGDAAGCAPPRLPPCDLPPPKPLKRLVPLVPMPPLPRVGGLGLSLTVSSIQARVSNAIRMGPPSLRRFMEPHMDDATAPDNGLHMLTGAVSTGGGGGDDAADDEVVLVGFQDEVDAVEMATQWPDASVISMEIDEAAMHAGDALRLSMVIVMPGPPSLAESERRSVKMWNRRGDCAPMRLKM
jgi:hypothetical protein